MIGQTEKLSTICHQLLQGGAPHLHSQSRWLFRSLIPRMTERYLWVVTWLPLLGAMGPVLLPSPGEGYPCPAPTRARIDPESPWHVKETAPPSLGLLLRASHHDPTTNNRTLSELDVSLHEDELMQELVQGYFCLGLAPAEVLRLI